MNYILYQLLLVLIWEVQAGDAAKFVLPSTDPKFRAIEE